MYNFNLFVKYNMIESDESDLESAKHYILNNSDLIDDNNFNQLYDNIKDAQVTVTTLITEIFYMADIDPLKYMNTIPDHFLAGSNVESFKIPDNISRIEEGAFDECTELKALYLPKSLQYIGEFVVDNCINLTDIYYPGTIKDFDKVFIEDDWYDIDTAKFTLHCKDGDIYP